MFTTSVYLTAYREVEPDSADVAAAPADGVSAGVGGQGVETVLSHIGTVLTAHSTTAKRHCFEWRKIVVHRSICHITTEHSTTHFQHLQRYGFFKLVACSELN